MSDHTPRVFVDNQRLHLIYRKPSPRPPTAADTHQGVDPFDVVDRVTISDAARERYRRYEDERK